MVIASGAPRPSPSVPTQRVTLSRWVAALGGDGLLLALLWHEHLLPARIPFELGGWLATLFVGSAALQLLRQQWLAWRVRRVFGASIAHLQPALLPRAYRWASAAGDVLVTATLWWTQQRVLGVAYSVVTVAVHGLSWRAVRRQRAAMAAQQPQ